MATASRSNVSAGQLLRGESQDIDFIDDAYTRAVSEWSQIEALPILIVSQEAPVTPEEEPSVRSSPDADIWPPAKETTARPNADLECFIDYVKTVDLSAELPHIVCHRDRSVVTTISRKVLRLGPKSIKRKLKSERNRIFALALKGFDNGEPIHMRMLTSIFQTLRKEKGFRCGRIGCHWEEIGFQGMDPASDLRGVGILGLFQLTFFVMSPHTAQLAHDIYALSTKKNSDFPFCVMGLNLTQIALHHLRDGTLNREINRTRNPLLTFNLFYASLFMKLSELWRGRSCTVADTGFVLRDLRLRCGKSVRRSILAIAAYKGPEEQQTIASEEIVVFSDIGNIVNPEARDREEGEENLV